MGCFCWYFPVKKSQCSWIWGITTSIWKIRRNTKLPKYNVFCIWFLLYKLYIKPSSIVFHDTRYSVCLQKMYQIDLSRLCQKPVKIVTFKPLSIGKEEQPHKPDVNLDSYFLLYDRILLSIGWLKRCVILFSMFFGVSRLLFLHLSFTKFFSLPEFLDSFNNFHETSTLAINTLLLTPQQNPKLWLHTINNLPTTLHHNYILIFSRKLLKLRKLRDFSYKNFKDFVS